MFDFLLPSGSALLEIIENKIEIQKLLTKKVLMTKSGIISLFKRRTVLNWFLSSSNKFMRNVLLNSLLT